VQGTLLPEPPQESTIDIDDEPTQPLERVKRKREKKKLGKLPWVPQQERRVAAKEDPVDFAALYEEKPRSRASFLDIGLRDGELTWEQRREAEEAQEEKEELGAVARREDTLGGAAWVLKETWEFLTQVLSGILQFMTTPVQYLIWPTLAVLAIATVASYRGASHVSTAERSAQSSWHQLATTLDDSKGVIEELSEVGGNRQVLDVHLEAYQQARTEEEKEEAALKLSAVVEEQYSRLGEAEDPSIERRRKVLESRIRHLRRNKQAYLDTKAGWVEAASTTTGKLAVSLGLAGAPPGPQE